MPQVTLPTGQVILVDDILHVPNLAKILLSICQVTSKGKNQVAFMNGRCIITTSIPCDKDFIITCDQVARLYPFGVGLCPTNQSLSVVTLSNIMETTRLCECMGQLNISSLIQMQNLDLVIGLPHTRTNSTLPLCEGCIFGK